MSNSSRFELTKDKLEFYLKEVAKEYRKLNRNGSHAEIIIVGGGAILMNYSFRLSTTDIDAYMQASSTIKEAINKITDKYALPNGWLNSEFKNTDSFSEKLILYSRYHKTYYNIFDVRFITREYLIAMKLKSGRKYKNDLSDIVGILDEHIRMNDPVTLNEIQKAYEQLYGDWYKMEDDISNFITSLFKTTDSIHEVYEVIRKQEREAKTLLIDYEKSHPGVTTVSNVESILEALKKKKR